MANFNDFFANACLLHLSPNNFSYTWSNFQEEKILVKLNRFLISPTWEAHCPTSMCIGKSRIVSDHILIYLNTKPPGWGPFPFRFYKSWLLHQGFDAVVRDSWNSFYSNADPIKKFSYKLKATKSANKSWLSTNRDNHQFRLMEIENQILALDIRAETTSLSPLEWQTVIFSNTMKIIGSNVLIFSGSRKVI